VIIEDGKMVSGTIDEAAIGPFSGIIIDKIFRKFGSSEASRFIDRMTRLAVGFISMRGFSTGIDDYDIPQSAVQRIKEISTGAITRIEKLIETYNNHLMQSLPGRSLEETLEIEILSETGRVRDESGKIASAFLGLNNPSVIMARSGARAKMLNISEVAGMVGQQSVRGGRINRGYYQRTLSHFKPGDIGANSRGFVKSSYKSGLNPLEYFLHSIGGREGLVDIAVRTSRSGYMQRRLINAFEDLKVDERSRVEDTVGSIIQFKYGDDGIDPTRSEKGETVDIEDMIFNLQESGSQ
jgi:DNA-directed RNA polymerase subunit A'